MWDSPLQDERRLSHLTSGLMDSVSGKTSIKFNHAYVWLKKAANKSSIDMYQS
jgi:hypothetical protein